MTTPYSGTEHNTVSFYLLGNSLGVDGGGGGGLSADGSEGEGGRVGVLLFDRWHGHIFGVFVYVGWDEWYSCFGGVIMVAVADMSEEVMLYCEVVDGDGICHK